MASDKLIQKVISGIELYRQKVTRNGRYLVVTSLNITNGARNRPYGYWEHVYESGGFESHNSFYGKFDEPFESPEEAAQVAIRRRGIVAVDSCNRAVIKKGK